MAFSSTLKAPPVLNFMQVADWLLSAVATKHNLLVLANTTYYMETYYYYYIKIFPLFYDLSNNIIIKITVESSSFL